MFNLLPFGKLSSLKAIFWLLAILLGVIQGWSYRNTFWEDGISYVDIGDAFVRGDRSAVINGYWSPLYCLLLGLVLNLLKPSPYWEFPTVHFANLLIFIVALGCFEFFLSELIFYYQKKVSIESSPHRAFRIPEWVWVVCGYTLFIWSSINWIRLPVEDTAAVTPDMCVAALVYLAAGLVLRIRAKSDTWLNFIILGVVLGLGYLAKAAMFPLAFIFLAISLFSVGNLRRAFPKALVALLIFTLTVTPFITALSKEKGRLTFGDTGKLNYVWFVNDVKPMHVHWQGEQPDTGTPKHPTRKVFDNPPVYEFASPIGGTYPPWYDASYWYEGVKYKFNLSRQIDVFIRMASLYYKLFIAQLVFIYLILAGMGSKFKLALKDLAQNWCLLIPAVVALGMYLLVYAEPRYMTPFIGLLFAGVLTSVRLPNSQESRKLVTAITLATLIVFSVFLAKDSLKNAVTVRNSEHVEWQIADSLNRLGVQPKNKIAYIGYYSDLRQRFLDGQYAALWARLARVKIIAEVRAEDAKLFWLADPSVRDRAIKVIAGTGVKALVAGKVPKSALVDGWKKIGNTDNYAYLFQ